MPASKHTIHMENREMLFKIRSTRYSSDRYGNCEFCGKHASEVFARTEYKGNAVGISKYGHLACLVNKDVKVYKSDGQEFNILMITRDVKDAKEFMANNPGCGVIQEDGGCIIIAENEKIKKNCKLHKIQIKEVF